ncbi:MAG: DUF4388 domain-containing protein [Thermodesulfobacteriota bacterium]
MSEETFTKIVHVWTQVVPDLQPHKDVLTKFIYLIEKIDGLSHMERRFHREGLSFYHAISKNRSLAELEEFLKVFFEDAPISTVETIEGKPDDTVSAERLGGIQGEQVMFVKKIGEAEFYGALWPWKDKDDVVTIHLGICSPSMTEENHEFMYSAMKGHLTETTSEKFDASVRGRIQGVSLSSFLQMSEMEGSTCTLMVQAGKRTGKLHLLNGNLIDAETGSLKHRDAAYAILGWEEAEIDIQKPSGRKKNEINLPLMHLLMEVLKKKDEFEYQEGAPGADPGDLVIDGQNQPLPEPEPGGEAERFTAPESGQDSVQLEHAQVDSGGPEPVQSETAGHVEQDVAVFGEEEPAKASQTKARTSGGRKKPEPINGKKRTPLVAAVVMVALLVGAGAFWYLQGRNGGSATEDYAILMDRLENLADDGEKEKLLNAFIDSHKDDPVYTDKAMQALFNVLSQMEVSDYEKASQDVYNLPLDRQYYQRAEKIFNAFLARHTESRFRDDISKRLTEISELTDDAHFGELSDFDQRDYLGKLEAYNTYLKTHPDGRHKEEVEQLVTETLKASFREFSINIKKCKQRKKWDNCFAFCRQYRETFQPYMSMAVVDKIEAQVRELEALEVLKAETENADDAIVRKRYLAFIKKYPDSSERNRLEKRVAEIEKKLSAIDEWMRVKAAGQDATKALSQRVTVLQQYIDLNPNGPYLIEAENLLWQLEQQGKTGSTAGTATGRMKKTPAATAGKSQSSPTVQDNTVRLANLRQKLLDDLAQTRGRYSVTRNGTVQDNVTDLVWTMLDSFQELGHCMDYRQAVAYVKQLEDGGRHDWRMPTSAELAGIYQNSPYFPASGVEWYWSSEVYEKGYQTIANIVNAEPEAVYRKRTAEVRKCGSVRAVRP